MDINAAPDIPQNNIGVRNINSSGKRNGLNLDKFLLVFFIISGLALIAIVALYNLWDAILEWRFARRANGIQSLPVRWLYSFVSMMCGKENSCAYEFNGAHREKIDYKSRASAIRAAFVLEKKFSAKMDVYQCWFCRGYHVGHAHDLTVKKFLRITWFYITQRKRTGQKLRRMN